MVLLSGNVPVTSVTIPPSVRVRYPTPTVICAGEAKRLRPSSDCQAQIPLPEALATPPEWIRERNQVYRERVDILLEGLSRAGLTAHHHRATLYLWVPVPEPAEQYALDLLMETGVTVAPGSFFGPGGEGYVRIAVTAPADRIREAMRRLESWQVTARRH